MIDESHATPAAVSLRMQWNDGYKMWVQDVAQEANVPVDWHMAGGRAMVLALGNDEDIQKAKDAVEKLMPEHNRLQNKVYIESGFAPPNPEV